MPPPSRLGLAISGLTLAGPFIGFVLGTAAGGLDGGAIGFFAAAAIVAPIAVWYFEIYARRFYRCEGCGRTLMKVAEGQPVMVRASALFSSLVGEGAECVRCKRIYCTRCAELAAVCRCRSRAFREVWLRYR